MFCLLTSPPPPPRSGRYVVFKEQAAVETALKLNMTEVRPQQAMR